MAQQLRNAGAEVEFVGMIDTLSPVAAKRRVPPWEKVWLMRHWSLQFLLDWPARRRRGRAMEETTHWRWRSWRAASRCRRSWWTSTCSRTSSPRRPSTNPPAYEGRVALFKAAASRQPVPGGRPTLGWDAHVGSGIRVHQIAGSHFTMMAEPGVSELIAAFRKELDILDGDPKSPLSRVA